MTDRTKMRTEKRIMKLSFVGSVIFMVIEGMMAYLTGSHSILMDFIFDVTDLIMVGPFLLLVPLLYKPVSEKRPYGFSQVESLFLIIKYSILLFVTIQLVYDNIVIIADGGHDVDAGVIAGFEFIVFLGCLAMYLALAHYSRRYESDTVRAELYIWKLDVIGSIGVSLAFVAQLILKQTPLMWMEPYIDPVVAIIMSVLLIREPIKMIRVSLKELVLFAPKKEIRDGIREVAEKHMASTSYYIKFLDVIQTGRKTWVEIYLSSHQDTVAVSDLRKIRDGIRGELRGSFDQVYIELIPDIPE